MKEIEVARAMMLEIVALNIELGFGGKKRILDGVYIGCLFSSLYSY